MNVVKTSALNTYFRVSSVVIKSFLKKSQTFICPFGCAYKWSKAVEAAVITSVVFTFFL